MGGGPGRPRIANIQFEVSNLRKIYTTRKGSNGKLAKERKGDVRGMTCTFVKLVGLEVTRGQLEVQHEKEKYRVHIPPHRGSAAPMSLLSWGILA